jgi:hypothetical protein
MLHLLGWLTSEETWVVGWKAVLVILWEVGGGV